MSENEIRQGESFEEKMICENSIRGLLACSLRYEDDRKEYMYDITSKQSLSQLYEERMISFADLRKIVTSLVAMKSTLEEYLLSENNLILEPSLIFEDSEQRIPYFVFYPYYDGNIEDSLALLSTFLMERTNHEDEEAVKLVYGLYKCIFNKDYAFEKLLYECRDKNDTEDSDCTKQSAYIMPEKDAGKSDGMPADDENTKAKDSAYDDNDEKKAFEKKEKAGVVVSSAILILLILTVVGIKLLGSGINEAYYRKIAVSVALLGAIALSIPVCIAINRIKIQRKGRRIQELEEHLKAQIIGYGGRKPSQTVYGRTEDLSPGYAEARRLVSYESGEIVEIRLDKNPFIIGKSRNDADAVIDNTMISRIHAKIGEENGQYYITDMNSTNGTKLNGRALNANEKAKITTNDEISFAGSLFYFR